MTESRRFDDLTPSGQLRRLRALALVALREYDIEVVRCSFVARSFNTVFRVDTADGSSYALRVSPDLRIHADGCEIAEAEWVDALRRDTALNVPRVIRARDGGVVVTATDVGVAGTRSCVLFEWVYGRRLREHVTEDLVREVGAQTAVVHEHGAAHRPDAPPVGVLVADRVLFFRVPSRLDELAPAYGSVLEEAVARAQRSLDALWRDPPHPPHVLHGDIQTGNVMVQRGRVTLIDFQDLIWGFEIQDALIALRGLEHSGEVPELKAAFRAGYETVRPWPEADPEIVGALRAARHLNVLNFGLSVRAPGLDAFVARHAVPIVEWMETR